MPKKEQDVVLVGIEGLREKLADYAHDAWSGWMKYMFDKAHVQADGSMLIPVGLASRWTRQMHRSYSELPPDEKASDVEEADRIIEIMLEYPEVFDD